MMRFTMLAAALIALGCATSNQSATRYVLDVRPDAPKAQPLDKSLGIRPLEAARPYKERIVYRDENYTLGAYETVEWAELPRDMLTRALTDALVATGRYRDVGNASDMTLPDYILTGELRRFDEVRTTDQWTAECEVRLELRQAQGPEAVWAATLTAKEPLAEDDVSALPAAMSKAVAAIIKQAVEQIAAH